MTAAPLSCSRKDATGWATLNVVGDRHRVTSTSGPSARWRRAHVGACRGLRDLIRDPHTATAFLAGLDHDVSALRVLDKRDENSNCRNVSETRFLRGGLSCDRLNQCEYLS